MLLEGKVAIVTGASRGIGKAIAEQFIAQGATVAFTYRSSAEAASALEAELSSGGGTVKGFQSDAASMADAERLVQEVTEAFGTVDIVVNNAGITDDTLLMRMSEEQWDRVISVNLKSCFNLTKVSLYLTIPFVSLRSCTERRYSCLMKTSPSKNVIGGSTETWQLLP